MHRTLESLNDKQSEAMRATEGPVLVLAGAGSGKTRTLIHRIAYLVSHEDVLPHNILAVTFTNKAAGEIRSRAARLLGKREQSWNIWRGFGSIPAIGTFHSICARMLRLEAERIGFKKTFVIYDTDDQRRVMRQVLKQENISSKEIHPNAILSFIGSAKNDLITPQEAAGRTQNAFERRGAALYEQYQKALKQSHAMDFDDLLMKTVELFEKHPDVLERYQKQWPYIMIDEYQDTNHAQYVWARLLAGKRKNIFVVGDDWQGIYSWRGATIRNILEFEKDFAGARVIRLEQNYRSPMEIVELGNQIIAGNAMQTKKKLWTTVSSGKLPEIWQVEDEVRESEKILEKIRELEKCLNPNSTGIVASWKAQHERDEEEIEYDYAAEGGGGILDKILSSFGNKKDTRTPARFSSVRPQLIPYDFGKQQMPWNKYAILYRTNAQSRAIEETMLKYHVPYRLIGGIRFYERKEIKDTLAYIRLAVNPNDVVSLGRVINEPSRGIGEKTLQLLSTFARTNRLSYIDAMRRMAKEGILVKGKANALEQFADIYARLNEQINGMTIIDVIDFVLKRSGYHDMLTQLKEEGEERLENIGELKNVAKKFEVLRGQEALEAFLEDIALISDIDTYNERAEAVTLMTLHSAKGLEFDTVFIVGMEEGLLPHTNSSIEPQELEEERRLCYVGITRARSNLYMLHTARRSLYGALTAPMPSRFISELNETHVRFFSELEW